MTQSLALSEERAKRLLLASAHELALLVGSEREKLP